MAIYFTFLHLFIVFVIAIHAICVIQSKESPLVVRRENVATAGWFIGMMLAIVFLLLLMIIICILKRNRGGKYDVHDREVAAGRRDYEEGGFHEYPQA